MRLKVLRHLHVCRGGNERFHCPNVVHAIRIRGTCHAPQWVLQRQCVIALHLGIQKALGGDHAHAAAAVIVRGNVARNRVGVLPALELTVGRGG